MRGVVLVIGTAFQEQLSAWHVHFESQIRVAVGLAGRRMLASLGGLLPLLFEEQSRALRDLPRGPPGSRAGRARRLVRRLRPCKRRDETQRNQPADAHDSMQHGSSLAIRRLSRWPADTIDHCPLDPGTCKDMSVTWPLTRLNQCGVFSGTTMKSPFVTVTAVPPSIESPLRFSALVCFGCTSLPPVTSVPLPSMT